MRRFIYLVIAVSAIIGFGHSHASAQVINGCIKSNGTLKIVNDPADCSSRETPISWNQKGNALRVFDANGTDIGLFMDDHINDIAGIPHSYAVFLEGSGVSVIVEMSTGNLRIRKDTILFSEPACQGTAYVQQGPGTASPSEPTATIGEPVQYFIGVRGVPIQPLVVVSELTTTGCHERTDLPPPVFQVIPANEVSLSDLGLDAAPFPAPLYVGLPPE